MVGRVSAMESEGGRKALVVGVNAYEDSEVRDLRYAVNDATSMQGFLLSCGFEVKLLPDTILSFGIDGEVTENAY